MAAFKNKTPGAGKGTPNNSVSIRSTEEDGGPKPLSTAIIQELQNLKEKFKNDDEDEVKGNVWYSCTNCDSSSEDFPRLCVILLYLSV
jgi:hypothetical protein